MASQQLCLRLIGLVALLTLTTLGDVSSESPLQKILVKRKVAEDEHAPFESSVAIPSSKAQEFLSKLSRTKRNVWDRNRPDVQHASRQSYQLLVCLLLSSKNMLRLRCLFVTRGWRLTCSTGWTTPAPMTRVVSITMMKTLPSAHGLLTGTGQMSTMTTINTAHTHFLSC
ncbi:hypothetical protein GOODEAATRI_014487 [Goodea atripinnis]|uniref:Uncharacterized protein n=1 Tax=Goodea atripinnis TaxID=208336 RepID=A0ABV0MUY7_9TELE